MSLDKWGITQLYPTIPGGREWFSDWYTARSWTSKGFGQEVASRDPKDAETFLYCPKDDAGYPNSASVADGILTLNGASLRFLVKKPGSTWKNVEITTYFRKVSKYGVGTTDSCLNISSPGNHDLAYLCTLSGYGYYAEVKSDGKEQMLKELLHVSGSNPDGYSLKKYPVSPNFFNGNFPIGQYIGYKLIVQNCDNEQHRRIRYYRDVTDSKPNGGDWKLLLDVTDTGNWEVTQDVWNLGNPNDSDCKNPANKPNTSRNKVLNWAANSIQFRVYHNIIKMKKTSVREISPLL